MIDYSRYMQAPQQANFGNAFLRGQQSAAAGQQIAKRNKLAALYDQQGPALLQGDPNAVNALARIDAPAAAQLQSQSAQADAAKRKADIQNLGAIAGAIYGVKTPEEYQIAEDNLVAAGVMTREQAAQYDFSMIDQIIGSVRGIEGQLTDAQDRRDFEESVRRFNLEFAAKSAKPADEYERYVAETRAAGQQPLSRIDYAQAKKGNGVTITNPDGSTVQIGGSGQQAPKLNETESKSLIYFDRANAAEEILNQHEEQLTSLSQKAGAGVPLVGNYLVSDEYQQAQQAGREFLASILRKDTGAAITQQEFDLYGPMFLPMPGDSDAVLAQKKESRRIAIDAIQKTLGKGAPLANERTGQRPADTGAPDFTAMSDDELRAYIEANE